MLRVGLLPLLVLGMAELGVLLLEPGRLLAAVLSVGCAQLTLRNLRGCILFFALPHVLYLSLFRCSLLAPSE